MQSAHSVLGEKQGVMDAVFKLHPITKVNACVSQVPVPAHVARVGPYGNALTQQGDAIALQGCRFRAKIEAYTIYLRHGRSLVNRRVCLTKIRWDLKLHADFLVRNIARPLLEDTALRNHHAVFFSLGKQELVGEIYGDCTLCPFLACIIGTREATFRNGLVAVFNVGLGLGSHADANVEDKADT